jgi:Zn ribbon nucleic-acid-binding protein
MSQRRAPPIKGQLSEPVAPWPDLLQQWTVSMEECLACGHSVVCVHPLNSDSGECVACGSSDLVRLDPPSPADRLRGET